jgi:hypothetical protein
MAKPVRSLAVSTRDLIALREAELAVARAELALAQARASCAHAPQAAPRAAAQVAAQAAPRKFSGKIREPEAPATSRQLWMLHLLLPGRPDTRGMKLTRAEASARIDAAKAARKATSAA